MNKNVEFSQAIVSFRTIDLYDEYYGGISKVELSYLIVIYNIKKDVKAIELSKYFNCSKVYVSKIVKKLVDGGYIKLVKCEKDKRCSYLRFTDKGLDVVKTNIDLYMNKTNYLYNKLGEEKAMQFKTLLEEATNILNEKGNN